MISLWGEKMAGTFYFDKITNLFSAKTEYLITVNLDTGT